MDTKLLVIDDDPNICEAIRLYFENEGYRVITANDGAEGLNYFKIYEPDLVLLDMNSINNIPSYSRESTVAYSASESDVLMTVCDGRILYDHGTYTSLDEELLRHDAKRVISHYFD